MDPKLKETSINRADLNCANALACDPIFTPPDFVATNAHSRASHNQRRSSSNESFLGGNIGTLMELQLLHKDLIDRFVDLRYLAAFNRRQTSERDEQIMRSDEVYSTERSLLTLSNLCGPRNFVTSCCIAALIFIDNHLRNIEFIARIIGRQVARLKLSMELFLEDTSSFVANSTTPRTIFWTLYIGGIAAGSRPERGWFVAHLLEFCDLLEISCWEDAEGVLKNFLWPVTWNFHGSFLWQCVDGARVARNGLRGAYCNMEDMAQSDLMLPWSPEAPQEQASIQASTFGGF
jgi:hypothetical protein